MRYLLVAAVVSSAITGCTSTRMVGLHSPKPQMDSLDYAEVQQRVEQRLISITLRDGRRYSAVGAYVSVDSVRFKVQSDLRVRSVATCDVLTIEKVDHWSGAVGGFFSGAFGGGFLGWAYGSSTAHGEMRGLAVGLSAIGGALLGAISGLLVGGIHGVVSIYQFGPPSQEQPDGDLPQIRASANKRPVCVQERDSGQ